VTARFLPFDERPFRLRMGLRPLDLATWIDIDDQYASEMALKADLLTDRHGEVVGALDHTEAAGAEVLAAVRDHLARYHDSVVSPIADDASLHPIDRAGRMVQEDICLMVKRGDELVLGAASLCFPSRWRLADKLGRPMLAIHGPTPGYASQLGAPTNDFLARLTIDRPVWRLNWSLMADPTLFQPGTHRSADVGASIPAEEIGERIWLRVERQTLRRFELSVCFTIRTFVWPLGDALRGEPSARAALADNLLTMDDDFAAYKSVPGVRPAVLEWLAAYED
jgi:dimethylamine monooxygenase subunit A